MPGSGILTWMKGAVSSGGILQRVAEKAKSSVDSMITTLDPQMKEYLSMFLNICLLVLYLYFEGKSGLPNCLIYKYTVENSRKIKFCSCNNISYRVILFKL